MQQQQEWWLVSNWILTSCQPIRVISDRISVDDDGGGGGGGGSGGRSSTTSNSSGWR